VGKQPEGFIVRTPEGDVRVQPQGRWSRGASGSEEALVQAALSSLTFALDTGGQAEAQMIRALLRALGFEGEVGDTGTDAESQKQRQRAREWLRSEGRLGAFSAVKVQRQQSTPAKPMPLVIPPAAPPAVEKESTFFDVRFVDETGQAINALPLVFNLGGESPELVTNAAGVAHLDYSRLVSASVGLIEAEALEKILRPRWKKPRPGKPPKEANTTEFIFDGHDVGPINLKPAVSNRVIIRPPLGVIHMELWDKTGRVLHRNRPYKLDGPTSFEGKTDEQGRLLHGDVFPGDYTLKVDTEYPEKDPAGTHEFESSAVVHPTSSSTQVRMLGAVPQPSLLRIRGLVFDRNKTFVKPGALEAFPQIRDLCEQYDGGTLLIVGHTDTTGEPGVNDPLSLERAKSVAAYLKGDVDAWLANYDKSGPGKWGNREDQQMLRSLPDADPEGIASDQDLGPNPTGNEPGDEDFVRWFQRTRELKVDGIAGPQTRKQLITEYMELDGITLPGDDDFTLEVVAHGCGENFPLDETGDGLDSRPAAERDGKSDMRQRRVELFFFDAEFGVVPKPPGENSRAGSTQYPEWRERSQLVETFEPADALTAAKLIEVEDALFRTNSAVLMPEGEAPSSSEHGSTNGIGILARALRFNELHAPKKLLIAGHTDTEASASFNRPLSRERAELTFTLLMGKRSRFAELAQARHKVADYKQILSWCSLAFPDVFACDPGAVDDDAASGKDSVKDFQSQYNAGKESLGAEDQADLAVDGVIGPATWSAIFDVYEFGLREELSVNAEELAELRSLVRFLASDVRHVGFGESHPIEEPQKDEFRSQTNRRVELLFFGPGEEPDVDVLRNDPEKSEVYDPELYERTAVPLDFPLSETVISPLHVFLLDEKRQRMGADPKSPDLTAQVAGAPYRLALPDGSVRTGYADKEGMLTEFDLPDFESCRIDWGAREADEGNELPQDDAEAEAFFMYTGTLILRGSRGAGRIIDFLANMGHRGTEQERRDEFSRFYAASDNGVVQSVHKSGRPAPGG